MADNTPLAAPEPHQAAHQATRPSDMNRTRSRDLVEDPRIIDEDPLLISQTLTYVTDDGSTLHTFQQAPFSFAFKARFVFLESIFVLLLVAAVPIGAHSTVVAVAVANLAAVAWFWYNLVRSVDVTSDGTLRFWIGNIEIDVPFDKIVSIRRIATTTSPCSFFASVYPYRGFLSNPDDGVAIVTTVPSTPFWLWPRSAGKPERSFFFGLLMCPRLTVIFSPTGGAQNCIQNVETEMRDFSNGNNQRRNGANTTPTTNPDFLDV